jgi:two-component system chemotaxis response regulator CheB
VIRVRVVDDSAVSRECLAYLLGGAPGLTVVGTARNGAEAVEQTRRLRPDVIVMDVHMPGLDGFDATRAIMAQVPTPIVMATASADHTEVAMTFEALRAGALCLVEKPVGPGQPRQEETAARLLEAVRLMAEVKVVRRRPRRDRAPSRPEPAVRAWDRRVRLVAMGASTGGPPVVADILGACPPR